MLAKEVDGSMTSLDVFFVLLLTFLNHLNGPKIAGDKDGGREGDEKEEGRVLLRVLSIPSHFISG